MSKTVVFVAGMLATALGLGVAKLVYTLFGWVGSHSTERTEDALEETK